MGKLRRSIEQNKKKVRARRVLMALLAATVAFSGAGSIVTYADVLPNSSDKLQVTIDNTNYTVDYGTPISSAGGPSTQYYLHTVNTTSKKLVKGEEHITEEGSFESIDIATTTDSWGKEWFKLYDEDDIEKFAYIVNSGNGKINGRLEEDIHSLPSNFSMIGTVSDEALRSAEKEEIDEIINHSFSGTFDGQNHTVTIDNLQNVDRVNNGFSTGLFGCVSTGAVIQNIILTGSVDGGKYTGALAGTTFGQSGNVSIKNCLNHAIVAGHGEDACAGGLIGGNISSYFFPSDMTVEVVCCGNTGKVQGLNGEGFVGGLIGNASKASVSASFNSDNSNLLGGEGDCTISGSYSRMGSKDVVKSEEAFRSGEVAYLLNRAAGSNKWFQTCGIDGSPSISGDVVYAGYTDCHNTEMSYSNTAFSHTEKGHKDKEEYSYSNGSIVAGCVYCDDELLATINCEAEELSDHMKGVTVDYSEDWTDGNYPNIVIKYSADEYGDYVAEVPQSVGDYYLKAYVGNSNYEVSISDTYSVKAVEKYIITNAAKFDDESANHGYITIDKNRAAQNETVTVTVYPSENYRLKSLPKYEILGKTYYASKGANDNEYTFCIPNSDITITAEFEQVIVPPSPTPSPSPTLTPKPDPQPTPKPDSQPTPKPDPQPNPQPTITVTSSVQYAETENPIKNYVANNSTGSNIPHPFITTDGSKAGWKTIDEALDAHKAKFKKKAVGTLSITMNGSTTVETKLITNAHEKKIPLSFALDDEVAIGIPVANTVLSDQAKEGKTTYFKVSSMTTAEAVGVKKAHAGLLPSDIVAIGGDANTPVVLTLCSNDKLSTKKSQLMTITFNAKKAGFKKGDRVYLYCGTSQMGIAMYKTGKVDKNGFVTFSVPMVSNYWTIGRTNMKNKLLRNAVALPR